jgi:hypothetical protein
MHRSPGFFDEKGACRDIPFILWLKGGDRVNPPACGEG